MRLALTIQVSRKAINFRQKAQNDLYSHLQKLNKMNKLRNLLLSAFLLTGCNNQQGGSEVQTEIAQALKEAKQALQELAPESDSIERLAKDEAEKLHTIEYQVFDIEDNGDINHLNAILSKIGKLRWECFHIEKEEKHYRCFCKRRPKSYIRYLARRF